MFSKILLKLIDQAIIPVITIIAVRFASILIISQQYKLQYNISQSGITFLDQSSHLFANSASLLLTTIIIFLGAIISLAISFLFHQNSITPYTTARLFSYKVSFLIQNSFEAYSKIGVWITFLWITSFYLGVAFYNNNVYNYVLFFSLASSIIASVIAILDIEKKHNIQTNNEFIYDNDNKFLEVQN